MNQLKAGKQRREQTLKVGPKEVENGFFTCKNIL